MDQAPTSTSTAVVAGGGIAGAAVSLLLAREGWQVTLLERAPRRSDAGAGILLQPNGLAVLDGLGLRDRLHERAHVICSSDLWDGRGTQLVHLPVPDFGDGLDHALALRRRDLLSALQDAVEGEPRISIVDGVSVTGADRLGRVTFEMAGDPASARTIAGADLVIGADGVHSRVRSGGAFGARVRPTGSVYARALVAPVDAVVGEVWSELGVFVSAPVGDATYFGLDVTHPDVVTAIEQGDRHALVARWSAAAPAIAPIITQLGSIEDLLVNPVEVVEAATFVDGRLVLIGDAAHAMEPTLGQGANSALVDAAVLVRHLARWTHPTQDGSGPDADAVRAALRAYDAERRPAVRRVQRDATRLARMAAIRGRCGRWLRNATIRLTARGAGAERRYRSAQQVEPAALLADVARRAPIPA